jgi:hypothetical protein
MTKALERVFTGYGLTICIQMNIQNFPIKGRNGMNPA